MVAEVTDKLHKLTTDGAGDAVFEEVVNEGLIVGEPEAPGLKMPDPPAVVDFEDENAQNGAKALEFTRTLTLEW